MIDGKRLISLARTSITSYFSGQEDLPEEHNDISIRRGVFVTLEKDGELRGCIGFTEPIEPLGKLVWMAARAAAFDDPRFPPLREDELDKITIEVSVLTPAEEILCKRSELPKNIDIGRDGLIIRHPMGSGLLLPQVAEEYNWSATEFLENLSRKAGLPKDAWMEDESRIFRFQADIFSEKTNF